MNLSSGNVKIFQESLSIDNKMAMVHIAGYEKNGLQLKKKMLDVTTFYHQKYEDVDPWSCCVWITQGQRKSNLL